MRTIAAGMQTRLASGSVSLVKMLRIVLRDGTVMGFTDHDANLVYNLGFGAETYLAGTGILTSDIEMKAGLEPDNFEVTGPIAGAITLAGILGGRFNQASAWLFEVDWTNLALGHIAWLAGDVSDVRPRGSEFVMEIRNAFDRLSQAIGRAITNSCDADHGDARCGRVPETATATVASAVDGMEASVTLAGVWATGYFDKGWLIGLTGVNAGVSVEVERWISTGAGTGVVKLFGFLPVLPAIGDTFTLKRGCGKTRADCMARNNILNARGFFEVPGSDQLLRPTLPGQGNG